MSHSPGVTDKNVCRARYTQETQTKCTLIGFQGIHLSPSSRKISFPACASFPLSYLRATRTRLPWWSRGPLKSDHSLLRSHSRNVTLPFYSCRCTKPFPSTESPSVRLNPLYYPRTSPLYIEARYRATYRVSRKHVRMRAARIWQGSIQTANMFLEVERACRIWLANRKAERKARAERGKSGGRDVGTTGRR